MTPNFAPERFTVLPDDETVAETVAGMENHGFNVDVVNDLDAARRAVLTRIPERRRRDDKPFGDVGGDRDRVRDRQRRTV